MFWGILTSYLFSEDGKQSGHHSSQGLVLLVPPILQLWFRSFFNKAGWGAGKYYFCCNNQVLTIVFYVRCYLQNYNIKTLNLCQVTKLALTTSVLKMVLKSFSRIEILIPRRGDLQGLECKHRFLVTDQCVSTNGVFRIPPSDK